MTAPCNGCTTGYAIGPARPQGAIRGGYRLRVGAGGRYRAGGQPGLDNAKQVNGASGTWPSTPLTQLTGCHIMATGQLLYLHRRKREWVALSDTIEIITRFQH